MMDENELKERAAERYEQEKAKQEEALQEIAQGPNLGETETVQVGEADIIVKQWVPGSVSDHFADVLEAFNNGQTFEVFRECRKIAILLSGLCVNEPYNGREFWEAYYDKYGPEGAMTAFETIALPVLDGMENLEDVVDTDEKQDALGNSQNSNGARR